MSFEYTYEVAFKDGERLSFPNPQGDGTWQAFCSFLTKDGKTTEASAAGQLNLEGGSIALLDLRTVMAMRISATDGRPKETPKQTGYKLYFREDKTPFEVMLEDYSGAFYQKYLVFLESPGRANSHAGVYQKGFSAVAVDFREVIRLDRKAE